MADPRLLLFLSGHGFGHVAMTGPLVAALRRRLPGLDLVVASPAPASILHAHIPGPFRHLDSAADFGVINASALDVDVAATVAAYRRLHRDWRGQVRRQAAALEELAPDLVLSNIPYLPLAAAAEVGIPSLAVSSLNWGAIMAGYTGGRGDLAAVLDEIHGAYAAATAFLAPEPHMPMPRVPRLYRIGPLARVGRRSGAELRAALGLDPGTRLVMLNLGGIPTPIEPWTWPRIPGVAWLLPRAWYRPRPDHYPLDGVHWPFQDLLGACDALVTKPGYGNVAGAVCNGVPVLYLRRGDWPEEPALVAWLRARGHAREIARARLADGAFAPELEALWAMGTPRPVPATGAEEAADRLLDLMPGG